MMIDKKNHLACRTVLAIMMFFQFLTDAVLAKDGCHGIDLCEIMKARRIKIEQLLRSPVHCIGEGADGLLLINRDNCSDEERRLAEDENRDRMAVFERMSRKPKMMNKTSEEIGKEFAAKRQENLPKGILREIRISPTETTWWDGNSLDPRQVALSRVLALGTAHVLHEQPDTDSPVARDNVQQYEAFGVLDSMEDSAGERWYQVTEEYVPKIKPRNWSPKPIGWIADKDVIPWRQALVMRFTNPYNREPSLFFDSSERVLDLIREEKEIRRRMLLAVREQVENGQGPSYVVAVEPRVGEGQEQVIMYPVLDFYARGGKDDLNIDGKFVRLLNVAARVRNGASENRTENRTGSAAIDIIFVMDTTNSMKSYLENVLAATKEFARQHTDDGLRFGFIGYQDKDPQFSYITKEFTSRTLPASEFVHALAQVKARPSPVRGDDIPEAVFEGINAALDSGQWRQEAVKVIVLVGDAPGKETKELSEKERMTMLRDKASVRNIRLFAFHIEKSKVSKGEDRKSQKQYAELSSYSEGIGGKAQVRYYWRSIDAGAAQFRQLIADGFQASLEAISNILQSQRTGQPLPMAESGSLKELIFQQATLMYADNTLPEKDRKGWVCDKVLTDPDKTALTPMILLTADELGELKDRVQELKEIGLQALRGEGGTTLDFFELVSQNTKFTMVDPTAVNFRDAFSVPFGIGDLPYKSDIMRKSRSDFNSADRVQDFIRSMNNKLMHYEDLLRNKGNTTVWRKLSAGAKEKDRVVGLELEQLP